MFGFKETLPGVPHAYLQPCSAAWRAASCLMPTNFLAKNDLRLEVAELKRINAAAQQTKHAFNGSFAFTKRRVAVDEAKCSFVRVAVFASLGRNHVPVHL